MEETEKEGRFPYSDIFAYVNDGTYPIEFTKDEKRALRKRAKFFVAKGTSLYYAGGGKQFLLWIVVLSIFCIRGSAAFMLRFYIIAGKGDTAVERLVVEDIAQLKRIISSIHDTSHLGVNRTLDMVAGKYYWPGLSSDVRAYVSYR